MITSLEQRRARARDRARAMTERREAALELIDGREVATGAPYHGDRTIYNHWRCRCWPCTDANTQWFRDNRKQAHACKPHGHSLR